jgi:phosphoribosylformimino-5-aminoimidazole carboxamide ribotide isomerase
MELLPAIDLRGGRVVRLRQGDDARRTVYSDDPAAVLESFAAAGVRWVHLVDLDAALGEAPQRTLLETLAARGRALALRLELGGGLRDEAALRWALDTAGFDRAVVSSILAKDFPLFETLVTAFPDRIVPALDCKEGKLGISGWRETAAEPFDALARRLQGKACPAVLVTDVARDGEMGGPNLELARRVAGLTGIPALLSGGVHSLDDLRQARGATEIAGAVVGRALYDGTFTLDEALAACRGDEG